jgi:ferrous iron transport protein A
MTLAEVRPGGQLHVDALLAEPALRGRLATLGIVPGTVLRVLRRMPAGGPLDVDVRGVRLALRVADARRIEGHAPPPPR